MRSRSYRSFEQREYADVVSFEEKTTLWCCLPPSHLLPKGRVLCSVMTVDRHAYRQVAHSVKKKVFKVCVWERERFLDPYLKSRDILKSLLYVVHLTPTCTLLLPLSVSSLSFFSSEKVISHLQSWSKKTPRLKMRRSRTSVRNESCLSFTAAVLTLPRDITATALWPQTVEQSRGLDTVTTETRGCPIISLNTYHQFQSTASREEVERDEGG